jgi:myo-inositol catabolism protein IolC
MSILRQTFLDGTAIVHVRTGTNGLPGLSGRSKTKHGRDDSRVGVDRRMEGRGMMSDEDYGRAWAKQERKFLWYNQAMEFRAGVPWQWDVDIGSHSGGLNEQIVKAMNYIRHYASESEAYASLGKAVRKVHRQVPQLKELP